GAAGNRCLWPCLCTRRAGRPRLAVAASAADASGHRDGGAGSLATSVGLRSRLARILGQGRPGAPGLSGAEGRAGPGAGLGAMMFRAFRRFVADYDEPYYERLNALPKMFATAILLLVRERGVM